jgi:hypothetical protein
MKKEMDIEETFLRLTSKTYPYGYESELVSFLPDGYEIDKHGNYFYNIGDSKTIFTSHFDTACKDQVNVVHVKDGNIISTDGKSILGADDKAGVTIMLYMISKNVPGLYYFFIGEEVGCIGSGMASNDIKFFSKYDRMISFDRRGTKSIITHQSYIRCCSDEFADDLSREYKFNGMYLEKDDTGVYTDSAEFVSIIPECTNISVGYYKEHTVGEIQDIEFLREIALASSKIDWDNLITKRDHRKTDYKSYGVSKTTSSYGYRSSGYDGYDSNYKGGGYSSRVYPSRSYDHDDYYYDSVDPMNSNKKRKCNKKNLELPKLDSSKIFNQIKKAKEETSKEIIDRHRTSYYDVIKGYLLADDMTLEEFKIVKSDYLDVNDPQDMEFAEMIEKSLS